MCLIEITCGDGGIRPIADVVMAENPVADQAAATRLLAKTAQALPVTGGEMSLELPRAEIEIAGDCAELALLPGFRQDQIGTP